MSVFNKIEEILRKVLPPSQSADLDLSETITDIVRIIGDTFIPVFAPITWLFKDIIRTERTYELSWISSSESACCPHCKQISTEKSMTYFTIKIQDIPIQGRTVFHNIRKQRFNCVNPDCKFDNFFEQYEELVGIYGRKTTALDNYISQIGVESCAEGAARVLKAQGVKTSGDSILRLVKKKGLLVMKQQLEKDDIVVLGCDDINRRKGNGSTACTVFINADTHKFITMVAGKDSSVVEEFLKSHPTVKTMTSDRATAYASAANKAGIEQVADRFHLFDNLHEAIKKEIYAELPVKVILEDIRCEAPLPDTESQEKSSITPVAETTSCSDVETEEDKLEKLTEGKRKRYETVKRIHRMKNQGMSLAEISQSESMAVSMVRYHLRIEPEVLLNKKDQKKLSSESIAEPYKETIIRMLDEGKKHREIFKAVQGEGFSGSRNCIYQYLKKYTEENNLSYGRLNKPTSDKLEISRKVVYDKLIRFTSKMMEADTNASARRYNPLKTVIRSLNVEKMLLYNRMMHQKEMLQKKTVITDEQYRIIKEQYPLLEYLETVRIDFFKIFLTKDVTRLGLFIIEYQNSQYAYIGTFARGLKKDLDAVALAVTSPLSNCPTEGINTKIKAFCRQTYGRAKIIY